MSAEERTQGDWALLKAASWTILAVIDGPTDSGNGWRIERYQRSTDFMGNVYWRWHDSDHYWKPSTAPCSKNQPYDRYDWQTGPVTTEAIRALIESKEG